mgnify:FL=1
MQKDLLLQQKGRTIHSALAEENIRPAAVCHCKVLRPFFGCRNPRGRGYRMKQIILWVLSKIYYITCNRKAQVFLRILYIIHIIFACKKIDIKQILLSAKSDGAVKVELERCADSLTKAVTNAATVIAPDSVVAFGYMFENDIFDLFAKRCAQYYSGFGCRSLAPGRIRVDTDARRSKEISRRARREPAVKL